MQSDNGLSDYSHLRLKYYTTLNSIGRAKVMHVETANLSDLVQILVDLSDTDSRANDAMDEFIGSQLRYGILRESPSLWSGHYNNEVVAGDEKSLAQAIEGLSLEHVDKWFHIL